MGATMGAVPQGEAVLVAKLAEVRVVKAGARLEVAMDSVLRYLN